MPRLRSEPKTSSTGKRKGPGRTLKVFEATLGFYDTVVAAPSQAAALRAWGSHQNLFHDGLARLTADEQAVAAALAKPETVLRRAIGTSDPFSLNPGTPKIPDLPRSRKTAQTPKTKLAPEPPDRSALDRAEAALATLEQDRRAELAQLAEQRRALDDEEAEAAGRFSRAKARARQDVERERKAYVKAGGRLKPKR